MEGYKECLNAFTTAAGTICGRDLIEEFVCAKIWPLSAGWESKSFTKVGVRASGEPLPFPRMELMKPPGRSDAAICGGG